MENENNLNYAEETIPNTIGLLQGIERLTKNVNELHQYNFLDLFKKVEQKGKNEYYRNDLIWQEEIKYNTWDKNAWGESEKAECDRRKMNEVKGLYIFYEDNKPIYVGISRGILKRLKNHFLGRTHFEATLVYLMLRHEHEKINGFYNGERAKLPIFETEREALQNEMMYNWKIAIIPETDSYKMSFFEIYLACHLKTKWNSFETH